MEEVPGISFQAFILLGSIIMFILISFIVVIVLSSHKRIKSKQVELQLEQFEHEQNLYEAVNEVGQKEREKLATNVHDDLGLMLNNVNQSLDMIKLKLDDKQKLLELISVSKEILEHAIETTRNIALEIMPKTLVKAGYPTAIAEMCRHRNVSGDVLMLFELKNLNFRMDSAIEFQLYLATKEIINNILKHSFATEIRIVMEQKGNIIITISHNGEGLSNQRVMQLTKSSSGLGLKSIESRIKQINATIQYIISKRYHSQIVIEVPESYIREPEQEPTYD